MKACIEFTDEKQSGFTFADGENEELAAFLHPMPLYVRAGYMEGKTEYFMHDFLKESKPDSSFFVKGRS